MADNGIFDGKTIQEVNGPCYIHPEYGHLILKIQCSLDEVKRWRGGYRGDSNHRGLNAVINLQVLFDEIKPECIHDHKIFEITGYEEIVHTDENKNSKIQIGNNRKLILDLKNLKVDKYFYSKELGQYQVSKNQSILLSLDQIRLINKSLFCQYNVFEIYCQDKFLLAMRYKNIFDGETKDRFFLYQCDKKKYNKYISYRKENPEFIGNIRLLIKRNEIHVINVPEDSIIRRSIIQKPFIYDDVIDNVSFVLGSKESNSSTFSIGKIEAYKIFNDEK